MAGALPVLEQRLEEFCEWKNKQLEARAKVAQLEETLKNQSESAMALQSLEAQGKALIEQKALEQKEMMAEKSQGKEQLEKALAESLLWQDRYDKAIDALKVLFFLPFMTSY
mgnify:FL=1